jgi:hypothetical protein
VIDQPNYGVGVQDVDRCRGDGSRHAGVAGRANDVGDAGFGKELGGECVLARAGAENENAQSSNLLQPKGLFATLARLGL